MGVVRTVGDERTIFPLHHKAQPFPHAERTSTERGPQVDDCVPIWSSALVLVPFSALRLHPGSGGCARRASSSQARTPAKEARPASPRLSGGVRALLAQSPGAKLEQVETLVFGYKGQLLLNAGKACGKHAGECKCRFAAGRELRSSTHATADSDDMRGCARASSGCGLPGSVGASPPETRRL